ncbi:porin [Profundibacter sp.]|uniref:porin n=1 Tax=Profundibacter sp. TaxID=3101071 RepID=UPI003D0C26DB
MKKVLLATTALVAFAGAASADVNLSGSARFGLQWRDNAPVGKPSTRLEKRVTLNIDMSTETDSGLELGARLRLRNNEGKGEALTGRDNVGVTMGNDTVVYLKSGGLKLSVGNVCGALECMPGLYAGTVGLNGNGFHNVVTNSAGAAGYWGWTAYTSDVGGIDRVEIEYSAGDFSGMLTNSNMNDATATSNVISAYAAYTFGDWTVALGVQDGDAPAGFGDKTVLTVGGKLGDFGVGLAYADNNGDDKFTLNGSYSFGATTVSAFVSDDGAAAATDNPYGIGVSYDLGGASLVAGYASNALGDKNASAGIKFKF